MKNKLQIMKYRQTLKDFFKNVVDLPEDKEWRNDVLDWVLKMHSFDNITIHSFEHLFSKYEGVSFPVQFDPSTPGGLIDSSGNKIYFLFSPYYTLHPFSKNLCVYTIGKRDASFDISFDFELLSPSNVTVYRMYIAPLNKDGTNKNYMLVFEYEKDFTMVSLRVGGNTILTLSYATQSKEFDTRLADYLFTLVNADLNDILGVFITVANMIPDVKTLNITSYNDNDEVLSRIISADSFVEEFIFTVKISEFVKCTHKISHLIPLNDFLTNPSKVLEDLM